ncbi:MAG: hypothetical protein JWP48_6013 [Actinoallomurus sp.]|jgi:hypothetical protein|nr:hypothetical protein [Actinoallomurus sp.]
MTPDHVTRPPIGSDVHIAGVRQAVREAAVARPGARRQGTKEHSTLVMRPTKEVP